MEYWKALQIVADSDKTILDRGDIIIKDACRLTNDILDYRYAAERYKGDRDRILAEKIATIKNSMALLESELRIYEEMAGIAGDVEKRATKRIIKIAEKIQ